MDAPPCTHISHVWEFSLLHILSSNRHHRLSSDSSDGCEWHLVMLSFPWWLIFTLHALSVSSSIFFREVSIQVLFCFVIELLEIFKYSRYMSCVRYNITDIFFQSVICLFIISMLTFDEQRFLILRSPIYQFLFVFGTFCVLRKLCPLQVHKDILVCILLEALLF